MAGEALAPTVRAPGELTGWLAAGHWAKQLPPSWEPQGGPSMQPSLPPLPQVALGGPSLLAGSTSSPKDPAEHWIGCPRPLGAVGKGLHPVHRGTSLAPLPRLLSLKSLCWRPRHLPVRLQPPKPTGRGKGRHSPGTSELMLKWVDTVLWISCGAEERYGTPFQADSQPCSQPAAWSFWLGTYNQPWPSRVMEGTGSHQLVCCRCWRSPPHPGQHMHQSQIWDLCPNVSG